MIEDLLYLSTTRILSSASTHISTSKYSQSDDVSIQYSDLYSKYIHTIMQDLIIQSSPELSIWMLLFDKVTANKTIRDGWFPTV